MRLGGSIADLLWPRGRQNLTAVGAIPKDRRVADAHGCDPLVSHQMQNGGGGLDVQASAVVPAMCAFITRPERSTYSELLTMHTPRIGERLAELTVLARTRCQLGFLRKCGERSSRRHNRA
jgi:hypothetical protein